MGTHNSVISRAGSNASDTSTAAAFSWQIGAGTGSNPVNAADFPGGVFPSGTGTVAAGAASATITFQSNPDATFEPDETGVLTVTTTQSGVTIIGSPQPFTLANDDADPGTGGSTIVYGPTTTTDTSAQETGSRIHKVSTKWRDNKLIRLRVAMTGSSYFELQQNGAKAVNATIYTNGSAGNPETFNNITDAPANGDTVSLEVRLLSGSTTEYEARAVYGAYTQSFPIGSLTGTSAQGEIYYTGDGSGESFTITKN